MDHACCTGLDEFEGPVPRRHRTGKTRPRDLTDADMWFLQSDVDGTSGSSRSDEEQQPEECEEDSEEQIVAEALFDLANMVHSRELSLAPRSRRAAQGKRRWSTDDEDGPQQYTRSRSRRNSSPPAEDCAIAKSARERLSGRASARLKVEATLSGVPGGRDSQRLGTAAAAYLDLKAAQRREGSTAKSTSNRSTGSTPFRPSALKLEHGNDSKWDDIGSSRVRGGDAVSTSGQGPITDVLGMPQVQMGSMPSLAHWGLPAGLANLSTFLAPTPAAAAAAVVAVAAPKQSGFSPLASSRGQPGFSTGTGHPGSSDSPFQPLIARAEASGQPTDIPVRFKRCATHVYIAHFIMAQQSLRHASQQQNAPSAGTNTLAALHQHQSSPLRPQAMSCEASPSWQAPALPQPPGQLPHLPLPQLDPPARPVEQKVGQPSVTLHGQASDCVQDPSGCGGGIVENQPLMCKSSSVSQPAAPALPLAKVLSEQRSTSVDQVTGVVSSTLCKGPPTSSGSVSVLRPEAMSPQGSGLQASEVFHPQPLALAPAPASLLPTLSPHLTAMSPPQQQLQLQQQPVMRYGQALALLQPPPFGFPFGGLSMMPPQRQVETAGPYMAATHFPTFNMVVGSHGPIAAGAAATPGVPTMPVMMPSRMVLTGLGGNSSNDKGRHHVDALDLKRSSMMH